MSSNGSIAILTLWAVLFLSAFASAMGGQVVAHYQVANRLKWNVLSDAIAGRALEEAMDVIRGDKTSGYDFLDEPWADDKDKFKDVSFNGARYSLIGEGPRYGLTDENGKININMASASVLLRLFQIVGGLPSSDAQEAAMYLVDWRDADIKKEGGQEDEKEDCAELAEPYSCKNRALESIWELMWLPHMTADAFGKISGKTTIYGTGGVNINTADIDTLRSLGLSYGTAEAIVNSRKDKPFENISQITAASGATGLGGAELFLLTELVSSGLIGVNSNVYRGQLVVDFGGRYKKNISFVFNRNGELKSWNE